MNFVSNVFTQPGPIAESISIFCLKKGILIGSKMH